MRFAVRAFGLLLAALLLAGCAGLPEHPPRPESHVRVSPDESVLGAVARDAGIEAQDSGFRAMPEATVALDARLELIRRATVSLDVQYYLIGDDSVGRSVLRALRDAGQRGVRVRLLVDDLYTRGMDPLLWGLAATPNVEVRLFNPFTVRSSTVARTANFLGDFKRLNQRMHNKLLVADGHVAVVGGRNLADEYFFRHREANFIDFDMLMVGAVVPQLSGCFDAYWNSAMVYPLEAITRSAESVVERTAAFERLTSNDLPAPPLSQPDMFGEDPLGIQLQTRKFSFFRGQAEAWADEPAKAQDGAPAAVTVKQRFMQEMGRARQQLILFSPYFIPGEAGVASIRAMRSRGVEVRVVTNSLGASDEPLVNVGYARYRGELLKSGVRLFEVASDRLKSDSRIGRLLGASAGRLHAKMAYVDGETLLVGSMNLDPRSERINTEIGVIVHSREVTQRLLGVFNTDRNVDYEVRLDDDGSTLIWVSRSGDRESRRLNEPGAGWWQNLKLRLMWMFVAEDLL